MRPSTGPLSAAGTTAAAAVMPATGALWVRASTSNTPAVLNIELLIRASKTVSRKPG